MYLPMTEQQKEHFPSAFVDIESCAAIAADLQNTLRGIQGNSVRHSVLQGYWWNRSLDNSINSGTDSRILILANKSSGGDEIPAYCCCCSVTQLCPTLWDPMNCRTLNFPILDHLPEPAQTQVHQVGDAILPSPLLLSPSPPAFNLSRHQGLFKWVSSSHQVAKVLELHLQHQSFQWIIRIDFL